MPSSHLILCHPLFLLPPILPSIRVFSNKSTLHIGGQSIGVSALASFLPKNTQDWMDWLDLLAAQGTVQSLLQHHSSKASILQWSAFFIVQLSYPYMTTRKTIALTRQTFVGKVMSLFFNMLSRCLEIWEFHGEWSPNTDSSGYIDIAFFWVSRQYLFNLSDKRSPSEKTKFHRLPEVSLHTSIVTSFKYN